MLDRATRKLLESAFRCPVADLYGMTEMGLVAWQKPGQNDYVMASDAVMTEFVPDGSANGRYRMLLTNLDLRASPIIRFDSGDVASVRLQDGVPLLTAIEGRQIDTIVGRDGEALSPYRITDALRDVPGVRRFKVTQLDLATFRVDLEADTDSRTRAVNAIKAIFDQLLGTGLEMEFHFLETLVTEGSIKFRPVESRLARP
jgi:phenylacetate-CoA ligase